MPQRGKRQEDNAVLPTELEQFPFGEIRMGFDLHHGGLDPGNRDDLAQLLQIDIRQADRLALTLVHQSLERSPRVDQRHPGIIDDLTVFVPRVLLVARSKGERGVDDVAIDGVDLQPPAAAVKGRPDPLRTMIGVP